MGITLSDHFGTEYTMTSPLPIESNIATLIRNGQGFIAATGQVTAGASITVGSALFNPSTSGKNVYVYSIKFSNSGGSSMLNLYNIASDPAYANPLQITNCKAGGPASAIAGHITYQNAATSVVGTFADVGELPQAQHMEFLTNGAGIFLPSGVAAGIELYDFVASAAAWSCTFRWVEF